MPISRDMVQIVGHLGGLVGIFPTSLLVKKVLHRRVACRQVTHLHVPIGKALSFPKLRAKNPSYS